jgi:hypothetical protein
MPERIYFCDAREGGGGDPLTQIAFLYSKKQHCVENRHDNRRGGGDSSGQEEIESEEKEEEKSCEKRGATAR